MLLIIVDAGSKWPEAVLMSSTTAAATVEALRAVFARIGLPLELVSDNGPQFTSDCFAEFVRANGIRHYMGSPYHPATNGLAERMVQTIKKAVRQSASDPNSLQTRLLRFLMVYRVRLILLPRSRRLMR